MTEKLVNKVDELMATLCAESDCTLENWSTFNNTKAMFLNQDKTYHNGVFYKHWKQFFLDSAVTVLYCSVYNSVFAKTKNHKEAEKQAVQVERMFFKNTKNV